MNDDILYTMSILIIRSRGNEQSQNTWAPTLLPAAFLSCLISYQEDHRFLQTKIYKGMLLSWLGATSQCKLLCYINCSQFSFSNSIFTNQQRVSTCEFFELFTKFSTIIDQIHQFLPAKMFKEKNKFSLFKRKIKRKRTINLLHKYIFSNNFSEQYKFNKSNS